MFLPVLDFYFYLVCRNIKCQHFILATGLEECVPLMSQIHKLSFHSRKKTKNMLWCIVTCVWLFLWCFQQILKTGRLCEISESLICKHLLFNKEQLMFIYPYSFLMINQSPPTAISALIPIMQSWEITLDWWLVLKWFFTLCSLTSFIS